MSIYYALLIIPLYTIGNYIRGRGFKYIPKVAVYAAVALAVGLITWSWELGLIWFFADWLCFSFGWGKYFPHGNAKKIVYEKEFAPADWLTNKIYGRLTSRKPKGWTKNWQTIAMSLRFFLTFGIIKVGALAVFTMNPYFLLTSFGYLLAGFIYLLAFENHTSKSVRNAEIGTGLLLGIISFTQLWGVL